MMRFMCVLRCRSSGANTDSLIAYEIKSPAPRHYMAVDVAELDIGRAALGYF